MTEEHTGNEKPTEEKKETNATTSELSKTHPLRQAYTFWFMRRVQGQRTQENYEKSIKPIGTFGTVEDFWAYYNHLLRPNDLPYACDYHLFRAGVKPMWEDEENKQGGKFIVRIPRGKRTSSRFWEDILLAVIGGQFDVPDDEICGVVISTRYQKDILSLWNKHAESVEEKRRIHETVKKILNLPAHVVLEYKHHDQSIKDNSSFRNTEKARTWEQ